MIDSHAHLTSLELLPRVDTLLDRAGVAGVSQILNICTDAMSLREGLLLAERRSGVKNSGATTPHDVEREGELVFPLFEEAALAGKLVAIGETGLDAHYLHSPLEIQKKFMIRYLHLAIRARLPVIFHCREAFSDLFDLCDQEYPAGRLAVVHCFTGSLVEARAALDRGWFLSFSGIITFKKSDSLREVVKQVPLTQLLVETDAPYLAPQSRRGLINEPAYLRETVELIAAVKGISFEDVEQATQQNSRHLFGF